MSRLPTESKLESVALQILKSQFMTKVDNLTIEAMFVNQVLDGQKCQHSNDQRGKIQEYGCGNCGS